MRQLIILTALSVSLFGQSAYHRLGYGDIFPNTHPLASAVGHGIVAYQDSIHMTPHNPATLSASERVHFGVSVGSEFKMVEADNMNNTRLEGLFLSFPIGKRFGMSLATQAVADFESRYSGAFGVGTLIENSTGGIWDFNMGLGYELSSTMQMGLKLHAFQGQLRRVTRYTADEIAETYVVKGDISGRSLEAGFLSRVGDQVSLGLTFNLPYDMPTVSGRDSLVGSEKYFELNEELSAWPTTICFGVVYHHDRRTNFLAGIEQQLYAEDGFDEARIFALPEGWKPQPVASFQISMQRMAEDRFSRDWTKRTGWQAGLSVKNYYLSPASEQMIYEYALTSGTNMVLRNGRSLFSLSAELGSRGGDETLPDERFVRMKFGIQVNDFWFRKVKRR